MVAEAATEGPAISGVSLGGAVRALLATVCWSSSGLLIDALSSRYYLTSLQISMWRMLFTLPPLLLFVGIYRRDTLHADWHDVIRCVGLGIMVTLSNVSWAASVQLNRPAAAAALAFSAPAFIALGERVLHRTHLSHGQIAAIGVNLVGCSLAAGIGGPHDLLHSPLGLIIGLSNGLAFSAYTLISRVTGAHKLRDPLTTLLVMFAVAEVGMLLWGLPAEGVHLLHPRVDPLGWVLLVSVAIGPTLLAYLFFNSSLRLLPATVASLFTTLEPPIVAVSALLLLGRPVKSIQWVGIALIVGAVLAMQVITTRVVSRGSGHAA